MEQTMFRKYIESALLLAPEDPATSGGNGPGAGGGQAAEPGSGGDGNGGGEDKTFTQADVDRIIQNRLAKEQNKIKEQFSDYEDLKAKAQEVETLRDELEKLKEQNDKRPAHEKELDKLQKQLNTLQQNLSQKDEELKQREAAVEEERQKRFQFAQNSEITKALQGAKAFEGAIDDALSSFRANAELESDEDGNIVAVTLGGQRFQSVKEAATKFLELKPHFASANVGGGGTRRPSGSTPRDLSNAKSSDMIASGLRDAMNGRGS